MTRAEIMAKINAQNERLDKVDKMVIHLWNLSQNSPDPGARKMHLLQYEDICNVRDGIKKDMCILLANFITILV